MQGEAFNDLVKASNYTIGLTGTLLNGYADSLFYTLYRTIPRTMKEEGFDYDNVGAFLKTYGVMKSTQTYNDYGRRTSNKEKKLPGVSPIVFTKFLLESSVFLSLSDMSEGLPSYQEIPLGVDMDRELQVNYENVEQGLRSLFSYNNNGKTNIVGSLLPILSTYPDMPYDQPPIIDPDTYETVYEVPDLSREPRNKEQALIDLVVNKKRQGEKVLVYYSWTKRTDVGEKLKNLLIEENINVAVLENIASDKREDWINKKVKEGIDVIICNPTLVETGLDLLDFTTIVFYQMGYNIFTMRQASRRSWRLSQTKPIEVYFMFYRNTIQEQALSLMATKLQASMAIEGKFSEEGLRAMSDNQDLLTQIANSVVKGIKQSVDENSFNVTNELTSQTVKRKYRRKRLLFLRKDILQEKYDTSTTTVFNIINQDIKKVANLF